MGQAAWIKLDWLIDWLVNLNSSADNVLGPITYCLVKSSMQNWKGHYTIRNGISYAIGPTVADSLIICPPATVL